MKTNWRERFNQEFYKGTEFGVAPDKVLAFIETLLEEVISEIPEEVELFPDELDGVHRATKSLEEIKHQLRAKWLTKD